MKSIMSCTALSLVVLCLASPAALADKGGKGHGRGHSEYEYEDHGRRYGDDDKAVIIIGSDREYIRDYMRDDYRAHCPPGLAKKHNGCLPPGQAKKRYVVGYRLPSDVVYVPVSVELRRHLRPVPRGYEYVQVDKDILLIAEATKQVIDAVTLLSAVGN